MSDEAPSIHDKPPTTGKQFKHYDRLGRSGIPRFKRWTRTKPVKIPTVRVRAGLPEELVLPF